ncbi:16S rRNA (guanine(527)-N(7))-methyltransferase RsmG [Acholeplasma vituli]|uniref:Ribosomal RNA small subunit methyltransferase G n=1 Tax=Paracholeplasma vituli TaxID=69473 RepID=A0ABT2PWL6_9MOLU|nr:16S rRNA (guanine(527)-N(7))-methyltransferase RsmG [Paracholeplasma vituli]MCU0104048.1 16S rRNA (guanine(527)-N(7))-methyltransferase RsmG [Paracholeplasma vituli]
MDIFKPLGLTLSEAQLKKLNTYYEFLVKENAVMNLTAITDLEGVYYKHFYDSLTLSKAIDLNQVSTLLDIGSGAGFPGIVLKIVYPHIRLTIVDSLNKRILFLGRLLKALDIEGVELICDRAEVYALKKRNYFDLVTARAVAPIDILDELALPLVKVGGYLIAMKAQNFQAELEKANKGITILGGVVEDIISLELPNDLGERHLLKIKKVKENNAYPRPFKDIKNKPL